MAIRPVSLEMEGFKSFKKRTAINFPETGLILISGKYKGSAVSSGSGKSSILEAMAFALDICDTPATELKNWDSKKMYVKLTITDGTDVYDIIRDPKLSLIINGVPYESLATGAKEKIQALMKASPEILKAITYRQQRMPGKFINATDSQLKEFLTQPLGLNELELAAERFNKTASSLETGIASAYSNLAILEPMLAVNEVADESIQAARLAVENAQQQMQLVSSNTMQQELTISLSQLIKELEQLQLVQRKIEQYKYENTSLRSKITDLQKEITALDANLCPTCEREWNNAQALKQDKQNKFNALLETMATNVAYTKNAQPMLDTMPVLQAQYQKVYQQLNELKAPAQMAASAYSMAQSNLSLLEKKRASYADMFNKIATLKQSVVVMEKDRDIAVQAGKLLGRGGFMGSIFDEILQDIESRANQMISYLPNVSPFSVIISSTTVTKTKGTAKKEIAVSVSKEGKEVSIRSLSGGQQCGLELCADLASAEAIRSRAGTALGWICLDEAMDGLGTEEKYAAMSMIKERVKGLVLIIDHASEIKESFDKVIEIEYDGRESYVTAS